MDIHKILENDIFLFDVDDTLLYTFENGFLKINATAIENGYEKISFKEYRDMYGTRSFEQCLMEWFPGCDVETMSEAYARQYEKYPYRPVCDFGSIQNRLLERGINCGILTNGHHDRKLLRKLRVASADVSNLIGIWGKEDIPFPKPDPRALDPVRTKFPGSKIVYFGDSYADHKMCSDAGIAFVQVNTGKEEVIDRNDHLTTIRDILDYL